MIVELPPALASAIAAIAQDMGDVRGAVAAQSGIYRQAKVQSGRQKTDAAGPRGRAAYLATRLPATYAVAHVVLREAQEILKRSKIQSTLDVGAGPGTAALAAAQIFGDLRCVTLVESQSAWHATARTLWNATVAPDGCDWKWLTQAADAFTQDQSDLVISAYMLNEIAAHKHDEIVARLWAHARQGLVLIEPGTPAGFVAIRRAREILIAAGAEIAAPCGHNGLCPMSAADWCHRPVRLKRTNVHQRAKSAALSYEDEKFSYLIACREPSRAPAPRIVKRPQIRGGHIRLTLCRPNTLETEIVSRRDGPLFHAAKDAQWGGTWGEPGGS